jgi:hypothetical protein
MQRVQRREVRTSRGRRAGMLRCSKERRVPIRQYSTVPHSTPQYSRAVMLRCSTERRVPIHSTGQTVAPCRSGMASVGTSTGSPSAGRSGCAGRKQQESMTRREADRSGTPPQSLAWTACVTKALAAGLRRTLGQRSVAGSCRFPFDAYSSRSTMKRTCWPIATCASVCFFIHLKRL